MTSESYLCLTDSNNNVLYNGPFSGASSLSFHDSIPVSAAAGNQLIDYVTIYAGTGSNQCGAVTTPFQTGITGSNPGAASLTNAAMGQSIDPTFTFTFTAYEGRGDGEGGLLTPSSYPSAVTSNCSLVPFRVTGTTTSVQGKENLCTEVAVYSPFV